VILAAGATLRGEVVRPDPGKTKSSENLRAVFKEVVAAAEKSAVVVQSADKEKGSSAGGQVALGTVVSADGFVLTKASEVMGREKLQVVVGGKTLDAKVVGVSEPHDLAMLKVEASGLVPAVWAKTAGENVIEVGQWVASAGPMAAGGEAMPPAPPLAVGVVSVGRRKIPGRNGFLGVSLGDTDNKGAKIDQVITESAAEKAGLKVDDVVTAVNGRPVKNPRELIDTVHQFRPGDVVMLTVKRGDKTLELKAALGATLGGGQSRFNMMSLMGGPVSKRASDFPAVFQHDTVIRPMDCGGPLVDLSGRVIGINIARAGRTETYALPADVI
jgi:serine protease Do